MITVASVQYITTTITIIIAYIFALSLGGFVRAWMAKNLGDATAEQAGFLTLDPIKHVDPIGLVLLVFLRVGWIRSCPIDSAKLKKKSHGFLRVVVAFFSDFMTYLFLSVSALISLFALFGVEILYVLLHVKLETLSQAFLAHNFPSQPSYVLSIGLFLVALLYLSIFLATLTLLWSAFEFVMAYYAENISLYLARSRYAMLVVFFLTMFLVFPIIYKGVIIGAFYMALVFGRLFGII